MQVVDNVPMPVAVRGTRELRYPVNTLEVGQALVINVPEGLSRAEFAAAMRPLRMCAYHYAKRSGRKFTVRQLDDTRFGCWRIA